MPPNPLMVGGALISRVKVDWLVKIPSVTLTPTVVLPAALGAPETVKVRLAPLPPIRKLPKGTREGLPEMGVRIRLPAGVSASPMVKGIGAEL